jgi:uncharacterized protein YaaQ
MKTSGIVADNYKVDRFKKELNEAGFNNYTVHVNGGILAGTTTIKVRHADSQLQDVHKICQMVELHFKQRN